MAELTVISFYTIDTPYEQDADRLMRSLNKHDVQHYVRGVSLGGDWFDATRYKAEFIDECRRDMRGPLLWIDADAYVHAPLTYFDSLDADLGAHYFAGPSWPHADERLPLDRLLSGTLYFGDTDNAAMLIDAWVSLNRVLDNRGIREGGGQKNLWYLTTCMKDLRIARLPGEYCYVFDKPWAYPAGCNPIIEHLIASRENRGESVGKTNASRQKRIKELEAML